MPGSTTVIFFSLNVRFVDSKSLLGINDWPYILFSTVGACYQIDNIATITWQITFNERNVLPVTLHLNLLSVMKKFLQMSYLLQLPIVGLLLMLSLLYK